MPNANKPVKFFQANIFIREVLVIFIVKHFKKNTWVLFEVIVGYSTFPPGSGHNFEICLDKTHVQSHRAISICNLNDFIKQVEEVAQCSICLEKIRPPVKICMKGHGICSVPCGAHQTKCPYCRSPFSKVSCRMLEHILNIMPTSCAYSNKGCQDFNFMSNHHEQFCRYRPITCALGDVEKPCTWKGTVVNWLDHTKTFHTNNFTASVSVGENNLLFQDFLKLTSRKYAHFVSESKSVLILSTFVNNSTLHLTLQQVSYSKPAFTYSYGISFKDKENVIFKYRLKSEMGNTNALKQLVHCMRVPMDEIVELLDENGALPLLVHVLKIGYTHK